MWLDFENDRVEPPITDPKVSELAKTLGKDLPTLEFELIIASRFSRAEMTERYGWNGFLDSLLSSVVTSCQSLGRESGSLMEAELALGCL